MLPSQLSAGNGALALIFYTSWLFSIETSRSRRLKILYKIQRLFCLVNTRFITSTPKISSNRIATIPRSLSQICLSKLSQERQNINWTETILNLSRQHLAKRVRGNHGDSGRLYDFRLKLQYLRYLYRYMSCDLKISVIFKL